MNPPTGEETWESLLAAPSVMSAAPISLLTRGDDLSSLDTRPEPSLAYSSYPTPPNDVERDAYLSSQHRWLGPATFSGYALIVVSITYFIGNQTAGLALALPLAVSACATTMALVTTVWKSRLTLDVHRSIVADWRPVAYPSIDVFLPTAGEDLGLLANTYHHVSLLRWPGELRFYVLDDSGREAVRDLSLEHGFTYMSRPNRGEFKKAGNLHFGFERTSGELIALFDADFVPRQDFLHELVPYFDDMRTAIVQSPQFFDVTADMNWLQRAAGSTQILFYRYVQPSRDSCGASICVGTSAVYRRSSLARVGGFARISHSEDVHTGINLIRAGFGLRYVATVVSKGVCPSTFEQFVSQQYRWCSGSMSLLFSRRFHSIKMTLAQRLSYWSGFLFYISTAIDVFTSALPPLLMVYFAADEVGAQDYVFVLMALAVRQAVIPFITGGGDSLTNVARIQLTYSIAHVVQIYDLVRRREGEWTASGVTGVSSTSQRIISAGRWWLVCSQGALWAGIAWRVPEYGLGSYWPMIVFGLFNLYISYPIVMASARLPRLMQRARDVMEFQSLGSAR